MSGSRPLAELVTKSIGIGFLFFGSASSSAPTAPVLFFRLRQSLVAENLDQPATGWDGPIGSDNNTNDFQMAQEFILPPDSAPHTRPAGRDQRSFPNGHQVH